MAQERKDINGLKAFAALNKDKDRELIRECITNLMNTLSFRKLAGKTQVILSLTGPDVRTRLTHTIEVAKIAKDICLKLRLNEELAEAMALAHDIGHTPFGHVGERTLREIMCGCDTLGGKVIDFDFENAGFKHNLQSFRVLNNFEQIPKEKKRKDIWAYIYWGVLAHSKMTWSKSISGMDHEILISSTHCDKVYVCHYDKKMECKRNLQRKKGKDPEPTIKEICKPWYCAKLAIVSNKDEVTENDLLNGQTTREYLKGQPIKKVFRKYIYCSHKCYLAKLWEHKIRNHSLSIKYPYLFDHPFPNSFYARYLQDFFFYNRGLNAWIDHITLEAQIVSQADEIAQRQQDLEDGIRKGLLTLKDAQDQIKDLFKEFRDDLKIKSLCSMVDSKKKPDELGSLLVDFYSHLIITGLTQNFENFKKKEIKAKINIYCLINLLYSMSGNFRRKSKWLLQELCTDMTDTIKDEIGRRILLGKIIKPDYGIGYFYLLVYDHLDDLSRRKGFSRYLVLILIKFVSKLQQDIGMHKKNNNLPKNVIEETEEILGKITNTMTELKKIHAKQNKIVRIKKRLSQLGTLTSATTKNRHVCIASANRILENYVHEKRYLLILALNDARRYLEKAYEQECDIFFRRKDKTPWKNLGGLSLIEFYVLVGIFNSYFKGNNKIYLVKDIRQFDFTDDGFDPEKVFIDWKRILMSDAHRVLKNIAVFISEDDDEKEIKQSSLDGFEEKQRDTILKSEPVEKNDGKACYILTRLFKAYMSNYHQLPDSGLKSIISALQNRHLWLALKRDEHSTFKGIIDKLKKTILDGPKSNDKIIEIQSVDFLTIAKLSKKEQNEKVTELKKHTSNEIKAAIENRMKLYCFFAELEDNKKNLLEWLNSEEIECKIKLNGVLRKFRANLDNPILLATGRWKSILTRGICDYIASLTDQEAINEYEKLYAGIMELV